MKPRREARARVLVLSGHRAPDRDHPDLTGAVSRLEAQPVGKPDSPDPSVIHKNRKLRTDCNGLQAVRHGKKRARVACMRSPHTPVTGLAPQHEPRRKTRLRDPERLVLSDAAPHTPKTARPAPCAGGVGAEPAVTVARLERALETVAVLLIEDQVYLPIFQRLEAELAEARNVSDTLDRARAIARRACAQNAAR